MCVYLCLVIFEIVTYQVHGFAGADHGDAERQVVAQLHAGYNIGQMRL